MAENKFVVKTVFHNENGDTLLREYYRETREKHRSSRIWPILAMPDFLARVKRKLLQKSLNADTNHHFL